MSEAITVDALVRLLGALPDGVTEIGCHPGEADESLASTYHAERVTELETLCDARVRSAVADLGIRLCSFADVASPGG